MDLHSRAATDVDCGQGNPDISGIGVRLSFYFQNFLLVLLVDRSWEDAPGALWTFTSTSFGLTVAAIVQAKQAQLSFFQALQVSNLVWLANFGSFLALASYSRHRTINDEEELKLLHDSQEMRNHHPKPKPNNMVKLGAMFQMFFSMSLTLVTWARPDIFSNDSQGAEATCEVKYVAFFAANFPARSSGRKLGLVVTSLLFVGYLIITMHELRSYYSRKNEREERHAKRAQRHADRHPPPSLVITAPSKETVGVMNESVELPGAGFHLSVSDRSPSPGSRITSRSASPATRRRGRRRGMEPRKRKHNWASNLDPMLFGLTIFQVIVFTYFIVCTELLLNRNPASDQVDGQWGFGQILALIVVVPSFISVVQAFREHKFTNLHHAKSKGQVRANHRSHGETEPLV